MVIGAAAPAQGGGQRYLFRDGRRGATGPVAPVACEGDVAVVSIDSGVPVRWQREETRETDTTFVSAATRAALSALMAAGRPIEVYLFPDTDHGMVEFRTNPDGSRRPTRITDGYLRLLTDWIKGEVRGPYGRGRRIP